MAQCTRECIHTMFIKHAPEQFIKRDIDYYVISSLMKGFRNILTILKTKPKFYPLCTHGIIIQVVTWFFFILFFIYRLQQDGIPALVIGIKNDRVSFRFSFHCRLIRLLELNMRSLFNLFSILGIICSRPILPLIDHPLFSFFHPMCTLLDLMLNF